MCAAITISRRRTRRKRTHRPIRYWSRATQSSRLHDEWRQRSSSSSGGGGQTLVEEGRGRGEENAAPKKSTDSRARRLQSVVTVAVVVISVSLWLNILEVWQWCSASDRDYSRSERQTLSYYYRREIFVSHFLVLAPPVVGVR